MKGRTPLVLSILTLLATPAAAQSVLFDFESTPAHTPLPINQTAGDITALFTGTGQSYSVQLANSPGFTPAEFSGNCLYPNGVFPSDLLVTFSQAIQDLSILYAPAEFGCDSSATMRITGYLNGAFVATSTATAANPGTWPTGVLSLSSPQGFDHVVIHYDAPPACGEWSPIFMADNLTVTPVPALSVNDVAVLEGNAGAATLGFTVTLSPASTQTVTVDYATADGTATIADGDYVAASGTLTFGPGVTTQPVNVTVNGDLKNEADETLAVELTGPVNANILTGQGYGTITNDDAVPALSINDLAVVEGNAGTTTLGFTVSLSAAIGQTVTVGYATANGTATTADSDYSPASGTLTFAPGVTTQPVNVTVNGDLKNEANETLLVNLNGPVNATISKGQGTGTITNDDVAPTLSINDVAVAEGNAGTTTLGFTVSLSAVSGQTVTVGYATANGTATTADGDFVAASGTLTFAPGATTQSVNVTVLGDLKNEANETLLVNLIGPINATVSKSQGTGTITNDDAVPTLSINDVAVAEGNAGTATLGFTVSLSAVSGQTVTVGFATVDGTATTADSDYLAASGTLTFAPGITTQPVNATVNGDVKNEANETLLVNLIGPVNATISKDQGIGTIANDDGIPALSIDGVAATEGNAGTATLGFTVSLSVASAQTVTVDYATANGTATTADGDYLAATGTLTFAPGVTTQPVTVTVYGDAKNEANETLLVNLSGSVNATIADGQGIGTIVNDDAVPSLSINDVAVAEGNAGTTTLGFTVLLSAASGQTVAVGFAAANGTATTADGDYLAASGTLTFAPGVMTQSVNVTVNGDVTNESNETLTVNLAGPLNATILDGQGIGTITDDDAVPSLSINDVAIAEGDAGTTALGFTVSLSAASGQTVTVGYAAANGTATTADGDYLAASGTLTFAPGVTTQPVSVTVNGDAKNEANETLTVNLGGPVNATMLDGQGTGTITNDDAVPSLSIDDVAVAEGNAGTTTLGFTVSLSAASGQTVTVAYGTADGTATTADGDYLAASGTLTFAPGVTTQPVSVTVNGDAKNEANETLTVNLSGSVNATISDAQGIGTITNDDGAPTLSINDAAVAEGNAGTTTLGFTVSLSPASDQAVTVAYATADGTATTADGDYLAASGTLTFAPGVATQPVSVTVNGDVKNEANETLTVNLSGAVNATISDGQGTGTITNDDAVPTLSIGDVAAAEGNAGTTTLGFTVSLSAASGQTVTVDYATADGTATTADGDYVAASGTLTFTPGATSQPVSVTVNGDAKNEADETFSVNLTNPGGASILDAQGLGSILNDDSPTQTLTVVRTGLGSGEVSSTPAGISCGLDCTEDYAGATVVQLAATPAPGSVLVAWSGGCVGTDLTCDVTMDGPKTVTALFDLAGEPITWERLVQTEVVGTVLRRPNGSGWNAGAVSSKVIASGDGYVEYTLPPTAGQAMFGLSHGDSDASDADIDFALSTDPATGQLAAFEKGVYRGTLGTYSGGDRLRVSVEGGVVTYRKNGETLGTSTAQPTYPLLADTSLYSAGTELLDGRIAGQLEDRVDQEATEVLWRNLVRATAVGSTLIRDDGVGWNAGASSSQELVAGDGFAEYRVADLTSDVMFGLNHRDHNPGYADIDHALFTYSGTGQVVVVEGGIYRATLGTYGANDVLRVGVEGGVVTYAVNGTTLYVSSTPPTYPLVADASLHSPGAKVQDARMGGELKEIVTWTHLNGVVAVGDGLKRHGLGHWSAGAISSRRIARGDGGAEYRVSSRGSCVTFGLGHGDTDSGDADVDFALFTCPPTHRVMVFEKGAYRGTFGTYSVGDVLAVTVEDGAVSYRRNGTLLHRSSAAPVYPLVLDVSLHWGRIEGARLLGNVSSVPEEAVRWSNLVKVTDSGGTLQRPTGYGWDAGAVSAQTLASDGYAEYTVSSLHDHVAFGLGNGDSDQGYADIEHAIATDPRKGRLYVVEAGVCRAAGGTYAAGDRLRVAVEGGSVKYRKNGELLYVSKVAPRHPLNVDTSLYSAGATVAGAKIGREE